MINILLGGRKCKMETVERLKKIFLLVLLFKISVNGEESVSHLAFKEYRSHSWEEDDDDQGKGRSIIEEETD